MQEVEKQFHEDAYGGLKAREARLQERHDVYVQNREAQEIRRIAQLKLAEKVFRNAPAASTHRHMLSLVQHT